MICQLFHCENTRKLFGDEQYERTQHINFVVKLLSSQQTDNFLVGLNLDYFDIDVDFDSQLPTPPVIAFTKKLRLVIYPLRHTSIQLRNYLNRRRMQKLEYSSFKSGNLFNCSS